MSKRFRKVVKATNRLEFYELLALRVLIDGQLSKFTCSDKPLKAGDLDPFTSSKKLDIELLMYRLNDPRLNAEEKQRIRNEIINLK